MLIVALIFKLHLLKDVQRNQTAESEVQTATASALLLLQFLDDSKVPLFCRQCK